MIYFYSYLIFCVATGVTSYFTLYRPTEKFLAECGMEMNHAIHPIFTAFRYILYISALAPVCIHTCLKGCTDEYLEKVLEAIEEDE